MFCQFGVMVTESLPENTKDIFWKMLLGKVVPTQRFRVSSVFPESLGTVKTQCRKMPLGEQGEKTEVGNSLYQPCSIYRLYVLDKVIKTKK